MNDARNTNGTSRARKLALFLGASCKEVAYNAKVSGRNLHFDAAVLVVCFVLFECNNLILKPLLLSTSSEGVPAYIMLFYFNDLLGGISFLAYTNGLLDLIKPDVRFCKLVPCGVFIFMCGLFWEYAAPAFISSSTTDSLDLVAYLAGGVIYSSLNSIFASDTNDEAHRSSFGTNEAEYN